MKRFNNQNPMVMNNDTGDFPYEDAMSANDDLNYYEPTYLTRGVQEPMMEDEDGDKNDRQYMISLYPELSKRIQCLIEDECNKLEYEGSMMYDEYPDKNEIDKIVMRIYVVVEKEQMIPKQDIEGQQVIVPGRNIWLWDNVQVPFLNELFYRRRHRYPRRSFYPYQPQPYQYYRPRYYPYQYNQFYQPYVPYNYRYY